MSVPLHKIELISNLVRGEVIVGMRPALPVPGVHFILGNILAMDRVWPTGPPHRPSRLNKTSALQTFLKYSLLAQ